MFSRQDEFVKYLIKLRYILFLLPILLFIPNVDGFPFPTPDAEFSDIAVSHYPYAYYLQQSVIKNHQIPLWYQTIYSGHPLAGNPLAGLWYPPGWIALLFPLPLGLNIVALLHLVVGITGMYLYLRSIGIREEFASFSSVLFGFMPKLIAHYGAGHLTLIYAISWMPWLFSAVKTSLQTNRGFIKPTIFLSLSILADVRWGYIVTVVIVMYVLLSPYRIEPDVSPKAKKRESGLSKVLFKLTWLAKLGLLSSLLVAPLLVPLAEFILFSSRRQLAGEDIFAYSLQPLRLLGVLYPDFGGYHELVLYVGGVGLLISLVYLFIPEKDYDCRFWGFVIPTSALVALGEFLPLNRILLYLPGYSYLRVPTRVLFLMQASTIIWIASTLDVLQGSKTHKTVGRKAKLFIFGFVGVGFFFGFAAAMVDHSQAINYIWGSMLLLIAYIGILRVLHTSDDRKRRWLGWFLIILLLADWVVFDRTVLHFRDTQEVMSEGADVAMYLKRVGNAPFRVYSPSYALPQQVASFYHLELADGVDPMQLSSYVAYMVDATGVARTSYSVTIPPFRGDNPHIANLGITPDLEKLGRLNVKYVVADFQIDSEDLQLIYQNNGKWLYENSLAYPRAWVQQDGDNGRVIPSHANIERISPNQIAIDAQGPGLLVLSENYYPGWRVYVDGEKGDIMSIDGLFRGVSLAEGKHTVEFVYRPSSVYIGLACFVLGFFYMVVSLWKKRELAV